MTDLTTIRRLRPTEFQNIYAINRSTITIDFRYAYREGKAESVGLFSLLIFFFWDSKRGRAYAGYALCRVRHWDVRCIQGWSKTVVH